LHTSGNRRDIIAKTTMIFVIMAEGICKHQNYPVGVKYELPGVKPRVSDKKSIVLA
jgi:hypothetical protein